MHTHKLFTAAALATLAACGGTGQSASMEQRSRDAMPRKESVAVATPKSSARALRERSGPSSSFTAAEQNSTSGDVSGSYQLTVSLAAAINGGVAWTLGLIESITDLPPTVCSESACVWGPGSGALDPADWKLEVHHDVAADLYAYVLSGRAKAAGDGQFHPVVSGVAKPSAVAHRGSGSFEVDFDQSSALNANHNDQGQLHVDYSNAVAGQGHIDAQFLGVRDGEHPGQTLNAAYGFDEDASGGGSLQLAFRNLNTQDPVALHSRWKATGAGRGDAAVRFNGGNGSFYQAQVTECWGAPPFLVTWFHASDPAHLGPDSGKATDCAFTEASAATKTAP